MANYLQVSTVNTLSTSTPAELRALSEEGMKKRKLSRSCPLLSLCARKEVLFIAQAVKQAGFTSLVR